jgi:hypothetical protein
MQKKVSTREAERRRAQSKRDRNDRKRLLFNRAETADLLGISITSVIRLEADGAQLEKLVTDWVRATDQMKRKQLADEIQKIALSEVTYVPWGEWVQPTAFRKNVRDVLKFRAPVFWNVKLT